MYIKVCERYLSACFRSSQQTWKVLWARWTGKECATTIRHTTVFLARLFSLMFGTDRMEQKATWSIYAPIMQLKIYKQPNKHRHPTNAH